MKSSLLTAAIFFGITTAYAAPSNPIQDNAKFFSANGIKDATERIKKIKKDFTKDVFVETVERLPLDDVSLKSREANPEFLEWSKARLAKTGKSNIYIIIGRNPSYVMATIGSETKRVGEFTDLDRDFLIKMIVENFESHAFDKALVDSMDFIGTTLHNFQIGRPNQYRSAPQETAGAEDVALVWRWIGFGCAGLLAVLMITGLIRGFKEIPPPFSEKQSV